MNANQAEVPYDNPDVQVIENTAPLQSFYLPVKRLLDILGSLIGIVVLSPILLILSVVIRATSTGPAIYTQKRIGYHGREFTIFKFRTMVAGADQLEDHLSSELLEYYRFHRKLENDPRITKQGAFLRKMSLDELPQLFNILRGDMSIIGPRPMLPEEVIQYGSDYATYITMRPGLTGLWQVKSRHRTEMSERAKADREYFDRFGLRADFRIFCDTVKVVLLGKGA